MMRDIVPAPHLADMPAPSPTEILGALEEWLEAHGAMTHFLLSEGSAGDVDEAQWSAQHRVISKRQHDAIERAIAVVTAAKKHGIWGGQ